MLTITVLGGGKLAQQLTKAFVDSPTVDRIQLYNRRLSVISHWEPHAQITDQISALTETEVYFVVVSDQSVKEVARQISHLSGLVVHCSGSLDMLALSPNKRTGVLYPVQSFSNGRSLDFHQIPFCMEVADQRDQQLLEKIAKVLSTQTHWLNSSQRKSVHLAAVFVNNFVNYMYLMGEEICREQEIPFEILHPLILETAQKITTLSPSEAQTGPAIRKDTVTLDIHKRMLPPSKKEIYRLLTAGLTNTTKF